MPSPQFKPKLSSTGLNLLLIRTVSLSILSSPYSGRNFHQILLGHPSLVRLMPTCHLVTCLQLGPVYFFLSSLTLKSPLPGSCVCLLAYSWICNARFRGSHIPAHSRAVTGSTRAGVFENIPSTAALTVTS